jgi:predicted ATPase
VPEVVPIFRRAQELCELIGEPSQSFAILWGIWAFYVSGGDLRPCMKLCDEATALSERLNDPGILMEALFVTGLTSFLHGDFAGARACHARAIADYDDRERTKFWAGHTGQDSGVTHRCWLALALWHLGYPDQALQVNRKVLDLAHSLGHPFSLVYAQHMSGLLYQNCRIGAQTKAAGAQQLPVAAEQRFPYWEAVGRVLRAGGLLLQGRLDDALSVLREALNVYRGNWGACLTWYYSIAAETNTKALRFADARRILDEGLALAEERDERFLEAELHRLKGELHLAETNDHAAAANCFHTAIVTARRQQSKAWELRATMSLARLWQRQGCRDEARVTLAAVYGTYTEGFTMPDLLEAAALLEALA